MKKFAVILNEIVVNLIVADSKEEAENITGFICVEYTDLNPAFIGLRYNGIDFEKPFSTIDETIE